MDDIEGSFGILKITGIHDSPRPASLRAVAAAHRVGIMVYMLTDDHHTTIIAIADGINILNDEL